MKGKADCSPPSYLPKRLLILVNWSVNCFACTHRISYLACLLPATQLQFLPYATLANITRNQLCGLGHSPTNPAKFGEDQSDRNSKKDIWPSWCYCHSLSLASVKSRLVLPFWYWLTRVVLDKGPLNRCVCVCVFTLFSRSINPHVFRFRLTTHTSV